MDRTETPPRVNQPSQTQTCSPDHRRKPNPPVGRRNCGRLLEGNRPLLRPRRDRPRRDRPALQTIPTPPVMRPAPAAPIIRPILNTATRPRGGHFSGAGPDGGIEAGYGRPANWMRKCRSIFTGAGQHVQRDFGLTPSCLARSYLR